MLTPTAALSSNLFSNLFKKSIRPQSVAYHHWLCWHRNGLLSSLVLIASCVYAFLQHHCRNCLPQLCTTRPRNNHEANKGTGLSSVTMPSLLARIGYLCYDLLKSSKQVRSQGQAGASCRAINLQPHTATSQIPHGQSNVEVILGQN